MLINRPLAKLGLPIPQGVIMHDWWLGLIAASEGTVSGIKVATVRYRQHGNNDTGAKPWGVWFILKAIMHGREPLVESLLKTRKQALSLAQADVLGKAGTELLYKYISLGDVNWLARRIIMFREKFYKYGVIRNIAMFMRI
jgi:hypothetical protein